MQITQIVGLVNAKLAGEQLSYADMQVHLDAVIDEINSKLCSKFPAFSEFNNTKYPQYPDYNFFPDRYLRSVVAIGAASKFYVTDEEGSQAAPQYQVEYANNLFIMTRDYVDKVPDEFSDTDSTGAISSDNIPARGVWTNGYYDII